MPGIIGAFHEIDAAVDAIEALRKSRFNELTVYTPTPRHEFEHALEPPPSRVRIFTLIGGLCGATFGYWIAIWTSSYWPLVVGGKPIASWVPYTIFGFEVMVLVGSLSTVFALFALARRPAPDDDGRVRSAVQRRRFRRLGGDVTGSGEGSGRHAAQVRRGGGTA